MNDPVGNNLEKALRECSSAAQKGYKVAKDNLVCLENDIENMSACLSQGLDSLESSNIQAKDARSQILGQISSLETELKGLVNSSFLELEERRKNLDKFSITLFGRTMAGKSTLMEILTNGDGSSIGKGKQRTTRDVRRYQWKGLSVTDVPGVAAFEGQQDEEVAYEVARNADLILFMVTDDAPQFAEAKWLAKILALGKPVIGICNVVQAIYDEESLEMFLCDPDLFDQERLADINRQFNQFLAEHNPYARLDWIPVHLRARYLSVQKEYGEQKKVLMEASRFSDVETSIIQAVTGYGKFYRIRSFIDGSVVPMLHLADSMLEYSDQNSESGIILDDKRRQLEIWEKQFKASGYSAIRKCVSQVAEQLRKEVPEFAESHYEDKDAGAKWNQIVSQKGINTSIQRLQRNLATDCQKKLADMARELQKEISLASDYAVDRKLSLSMEEIYDYKQMFQWGSLATGALMATLVGITTPLVIGVAVLELLSMLSDSHEEQASKARNKLSKELYAYINKFERKLTSQLDKWFDKELLCKQVHALEKELRSATQGMFTLADAEKEFALMLNDRLQKINRQLIEEALRQLNAARYLQGIRDIARIPNSATMLLISPDVKLPQEIRQNLAKMLGEEILFVVDTQNTFSILRQAIGKGCDSNKIRIGIEGKNMVAHVPLKEFNKKTKIRAKLAEQLTGLRLRNL